MEARLPNGDKVYVPSREEKQKLCREMISLFPIGWNVSFEHGAYSLLITGLSAVEVAAIAAQLRK